MSTSNTSAPVNGADEREVIWECKIGAAVSGEMPNGWDAPMRRAVKEAFRNLTGVEAEFTFSGSGHLTETERAVVEKRQPRASLGAAQVPAGWALVPVEPTQSMLDAAWDRIPLESGDIHQAYRDMLAAAPEAPGGAAQVPARAAAWITPEGDRVVTAKTMDEAVKYGAGASASSMKPYSVPLYEAQAGAAQVPSLSEQDRHQGEVAVLEAALASSAGHLGALIDELRGMMAKALKTMTALHNVATPDEDTPDLDARIPADDFRKFVDAHAALLYAFAPHKDAAAAVSQQGQGS